MQKKLSLAYSTCPNDTYIFYALAHGKIDLDDLSFNIMLNDVEHLNQEAKKGIVDISKLSFAAIGHLMETYGLLRSGAALGRGCGPLIVARKGTDLNDIESGKIAVPGLWTTANLLLGLFLNGTPNVFPITFDKIMPAVNSGEYDCGIIIHEGRFTYPNYDLECLVDLGEWWESETTLPIPLGGIVMRRNISQEIISAVETGIRRSIEFAHLNPSATNDYVKTHAQELSDDVVFQHINLYVNEFSLDIGREGESAIETLFAKARERGILPKTDKSLFACEDNN
ncbi:MAG: 1,4-dihydroxy-6-naphthoate synthase [Desulfobacteraceae bacterium]|nr:1,4-dihydroxy-6-naphthoate synthase [Desulfobacteraceae bacterium]MBC2755852.1 1,4-dihydroxy-6-naphthoate synthase [Desulfobacteraceae bacterium]